MMMEKWALDRDIFLGFATHYKTGKRLDEGTYNKIISMRQFGLGKCKIIVQHMASDAKLYVLLNTSNCFCFVAWLFGQLAQLQQLGLITSRWNADVVL